MNEGHIPNFRGVRVRASTGYNPVEGNRRASRNGRVSALPHVTNCGWFGLANRPSCVNGPRGVQLRFTAPPPGQYVITVVLMSDFWIGCEKRVMLKLKVRLHSQLTLCSNHPLLVLGQERVGARKSENANTHVRHPPLEVPLRGSMSPAVVQTESSRTDLSLGCGALSLSRYSDEKVAANRDIRVWHGATENGP